MYVTIAKIEKKDLITQKSVAGLHRCQLSLRDSVYILQAEVKALCYNCEEFLINTSSKFDLRREKRDLIMIMRMERLMQPLGCKIVS